ncbi:MAG: TetR/AcrR family transcriptional regulator [Solirubrobacterales bacterium]
MREHQMLEAATKVFAQSGYHNTSMDQVAEQVGISKPMIYSYFDSKEGLYRACLERAGAELVEHVRASFKPDFKPDRALWEGFIAFFAFLRDRPSDWQLVRNESIKDVPALSENIENVHNNLRALIGDLSMIVSKETPGDPFADDDRRAAASFALLGAASALGSRWLDEGATSSPEEPCTQLMNFFWLGYNDLAAGKLWTSDELVS